ncbi:hypothetical protein [Amycolatopsis sp. NPDC004079]|uniref:hypothetical protein n=1 Tax=Amycolatopsis sp. NPDC004079 TaxID=3154549 RepID=UPI0033B09F34
MEVEIRTEPDHTTVTVRCEAAGDLALSAADELAALAEQASRRGGKLTVAGGSRLRWPVPVAAGFSSAD